MSFVFYGNNEEKEKIKNYIKNNSIPQAIIISGVNGMGKKTFAREIAKMVLCENNHNDNFPCNCCNHCKKIEKGIHPDLYFDDSEIFEKSLKTKSTKSIGVDLIRLLINQSRILPNDGEKNIFIIKADKKMTIEAQNALLKTLEEPNNYSIFIITCDDSSYLLDTVISRSVLINLNPLNKNEFNLALKQSFKNIENEINFNITDDEIDSLYYLSGQNVGQAIYIFKNNIYEKINSICNFVIQSIITKEEYSCLKGFFMLRGNKELFQLCLDYLLIVFRQGLIEKYIKQENTTLNNSKNLSKSLTKEQLMCIIDVLNKTKNNVNFNVSENINLTACCSEIFKIFSLN
ncbi:MAG: hypothetical protein RR483_01185 [Clostridia bacterium]